MHIAYIAAGSGWTYCGACARDAGLLRGLAAGGHQAHYVPLYTPIRHDEAPELPEGRIYYGGLTVSLRQLLAPMRFLPASVLRTLDHPRLLRWLGRYAVQVNPASLGGMTVSVLAGADGRQRQELEQLLEHLEELRPDMVHLSNTLLSGIAPKLRDRLRAPITCGFQGEDSFVAALAEKHRREALRLIRENSRYIARFIAPCQAARETMGDFLGIEPERMLVVRTGIEHRSYARPTPRPAGTFTIGYFSAIKPEKGLDLLVEAVRRIVHEHGHHVQLAVAGQILNPAFWKKIQQQISAGHLQEQVRFEGELDFPHKVQFLRGCHLAVFPSRIPEWRGVAAMEAMAAGATIVAPARGVFPELLAGGGGHLFEPENVETLTGVLAQLLGNPQALEETGRQGAAAIAAGFSSEQMVRETVEAFEALLHSPSAPPKGGG